MHKIGIKELCSRCFRKMKLEILLRKAGKHNDLIREWLQDKKRRFLFENSPQSELYGNLLIAKAEEMLDQFRSEYNPEAQPQPDFSYSKTLEIEYDFSKNLENWGLIEKKLSALTKKMQEKAPKNLNPKPLLDSIRKIVLEGTLDEEIEEYSYIEPEMGHDWYDPIFELVDKYFNMGFDIVNEINDELIPLFNQAYQIRKERGNISSKIRKTHKPTNLTYTMDLSKKDPLDVRFGNDSGCCIGIYENSDIIGHSHGLPHYMADNATFIFNIYQQRNKSKESRVGIVLAFDSYDKEGNRLSACNSIELSPRMNPAPSIEGCEMFLENFNIDYGPIDKIVEFVENGLIDFGRQNGFEAVLISTHDYNTSYNYSKRVEQKPNKQGILKKIRSPIEPKFYSEIVEDNGTIDESDFYSLYDDRKS